LTDGAANTSLHRKISASSSWSRQPRLVRWAAIEAAQQLRRDSLLHQRREQIAERRNSRKIAEVAVARRIITLTDYGMRDGHIRCLEPAA